MGPLPIALNGPTVSLKKYCRWSHMGPLLPLKNTADGHEWAQYILQEMLLISVAMAWFKLAEPAKLSQFELS